MGVRQRPTRAATSWSSTPTATTASSSPSSSTFDIIQQSSSSSPTTTTTTTTSAQHQQHQVYSPLFTNINLENDYNTANTQQHHKPSHQPSSRGSSSNSSSNCSKSDPESDRSLIMVNMTTTRVATTTTSSTGANTTMTFPPSRKTQPHYPSSPRSKQQPQQRRQEKRSLLRRHFFKNHFPSTSLLALFIMMASGCFFFNMMMVLIPHHYLSSSSENTANDIEMQQRRFAFSLLPLSSSNNPSHVHQLRQNNNNNNNNIEPINYYHARVVYSIYNKNNNNVDMRMDDEWSVTPPPPHDDPSITLHRRRTVDDEFMRVTESNQPPIPSNNVENEQECIPMADWQTASYPNCNSFHEIDLPTAIDAGAMIHNNDTTSSSNTRRSSSEDVFNALAEGWFRTTWQWNRRHVTTTERPEEEESVVIKTLRIEREFLWEYYDLHNRDAVAMERLTFSPYVVNVYGYCGQSAINEFADFQVPEMNYLEKMNRRLRGYNDHTTSILKLHVAARIATGLAHVHAGGQVSSLSSTSALNPPRPSMVHYDLNPKNVALFRGGRPKINDFNIAEFLRYNPKTNQTCGFKSRMHGPWWRAPEEMYLNETVYLDEKVDVYSLGLTLFHLLTSKAPRGQMLASREDEAREIVKSGKRPVLMQPFSTSNDTIFVAFREVFDLCHEPDPRKRGTAQQIADILWQAMEAEREILRNQTAQQSLDATPPTPPLAMALSSANGNAENDDNPDDLDTKQ